MGKASVSNWILAGLAVGVGAALYRDLSAKPKGVMGAAKGTRKVLMDAVIGGLVGSVFTKAFRMIPGTKAKVGVLAGTTVGGASLAAVSRFRKARKASAYDYGMMTTAEATQAGMMDPSKNTETPVIQ